jgi:hypothetical protein
VAAFQSIWLYNDTHSKQIIQSSLNLMFDTNYENSTRAENGVISSQKHQVQDDKAMFISVITTSY